MNSSVRATKSVSQLSSIIATSVPPACDGDDDEPLRRGAAAALLGLGDALLAEDLHRLVHVAAGLFERRLAIHHARAGAGAELADVFRGNLPSVSFLHVHPVAVLVRPPRTALGGHGAAAASSSGVRPGSGARLARRRRGRLACRIALGFSRAAMASGFGRRLRAPVRRRRRSASGSPSLPPSVL